MKKISFASLLIAGLACAPGESLAGGTARVHGNSCFSPTPAPGLSYSQWGPSNSGNTAIIVHCPLGLPDQAFSSIRFFVGGWSRNNATKLQCTLNTTDVYGGSLASNTAIVPYNLNSGKFSPIAITVPVGAATAWPYLTCLIPPTENGWVSYLSTIMVRVID